MNNKIFSYFTVAVLAFALSLNIYSNAQTNPDTPNAGGIDTPFVINPGDSDQTDPTNDPNPNPNIDVEVPDNPTISSEEIVEDTGETLPVESDGENFNLKPGPDPDQTITPGVNTTNPTTSTESTVRSGGLEVGLAILFAAIIGGLYYYYKKNKNAKSNLKTKEKKLKY